MDTDLALLTRYHRQRDAQAFQTLVESHAAMVHATARRVTQDAALAQDAAQETFLALARSSGSAIRCVGAWLHQAAWRKACMLVRSESRRHLYEEAAAEHLHTEPDATWAEIEPVLDEALAELPEALRTLLIERFLEGRTQQEIATRTGLSQSTVSRQIDQGITELQAKLGARGVIVSTVGLTSLLGVNAMQALPAALAATFGKIALSGVGTAAVSSAAIPWITSLFMKATTIKITLTAAVVTMAWVGHDLASPQPKLQSLFGAAAAGLPSSKDPAASAGVVAADAKSKAAVSRAAQASPAVAPAVVPSERARADRKPFSAETLARFLSLSRDKDFKDFITKLYASGDKRFIAAEIERVLGITLSDRDLQQSATNPSVLQAAVMTRMGYYHPEETLAWLAASDGRMEALMGYTLGSILRLHPDITAESMESRLPQGPHREMVLSMLRAQRDPLAEAAKVASTAQGMERLEHLWGLAELWPKKQALAGAEWALQNLRGADLQAFMPRITGQISSSSPDDALALLARIQDPAVLKTTLVSSMHGLVHEHRRMDAVLEVIDRLQGDLRADALGEISRRWIRVDQEGLLEWINTLESPADFEATLPLTLPQLSETHFNQIMDKLMAEVDPGLEAALIKTAMPELTNTTHTSMEIIERLTNLPQYQSIGAGQSGNQALLWKAVTRTAERWVQYQGGLPQDGARWIDSLPFRSPADKAVVAGQLYQQWKLSEPAAATQWAASAGVKLQ
ncbi:RNA polymerase sigma factor [Brevifollis gellanilyticus]|uniref:Uncharacterized protein n=1 Tax=Brevifollis gellanilyticus TaxID=748831 RepID=A0A512M2N4_9BACT|nr:sigma-70 family RNA polymerase sigma factor [Brevifollis gellanilyticus]GEP40999.1 hypothetical protein BGE01nite_02900 [Brevifollis gellanilyticus]